MQAGSLRHRVRLQSRAETLDDHGQITTAWQTLAWLWCEVVTASGGETIQGDQQIGQAKYNVRCRYRADLQPNIRQRLLWRCGDSERILHIESINDVDGRRRELRLVCGEEVS